MAKLNMKSKPLLIMVNGELFGVEEIRGDSAPTKTGQKDIKFLTIKAINMTGQRKLTIRLDPRLINALKDDYKVLHYIY